MMTPTQREAHARHKAFHAHLARAAIRSPQPSIQSTVEDAPSICSYATQTAAYAHASIGGSHLDPKLTFDNFVTGRSNNLACAAMRQIAEDRREAGVMFNPLFIHGGTGLGKTHLLQAVTWAVSSLDERKVLYLTAERFVHGFISAIKTQTAPALREALRGIDVLAIDDIQMLRSKFARDEFSIALSMVMQSGRQIIVAADQPPASLEGFDEQSLSRLGGGLVVEIGPLSEELSRGVLVSHARAARAHLTTFTVPDDALDYLAHNIRSGGRDLCAAINRLLAHSKYGDIPVTLEMAEREARDLIKPQEPKRIKIEDVQRLVAQHFRVSRNDILSARRTANVVRPRQVAMYLAKTLTLRSLPEIGRRFGGRDHTTVLHAVRKIDELIHKEALLADEVALLSDQLKQEAAR